MNQDELFRLGKIVRTFGSKGEVVFQIDNEALALIKKLESVFLKLNGNLVPFFIDTLQPRAKDQAIVKFLDIENVEDSSELAGCAIFVPLSLFPKRTKTSPYSTEIEGYKVIDSSKGDIGTVSDILELPQQALLSVNFNGNEILVPIVDEIIKNIDRKNKTIHIEAPEGLIDLYIG